MVEKESRIKRVVNQFQATLRLRVSAVRKHELNY